jgi:hypothetical protein
MRTGFRMLLNTCNTARDGNLPAQSKSMRLGARAWAPLYQPPRKRTPLNPIRRLGVLSKGKLG